MLLLVLVLVLPLLVPRLRVLVLCCVPFAGHPVGNQVVHLGYFGQLQHDVVVGGPLNHGYNIMGPETKHKRVVDADQDETREDFPGAVGW